MMRRMRTGIILSHFLSAGHFLQHGCSAAAFRPTPFRSANNNLLPLVRMTSSSSSSKDYYSDIKSKWATDYPSSDTIDDTWSFYEECGYADPQATLKSMLEPITYTEKKILDYGCDTGLMLNFFCSSIDDEEIEGYGLDINEEAIKVAKERFPNMEFQVGDGLTIPYPDKNFDVVICIATIKHVRYEDRAAVYAELNRVSHYVLIIEADESEQKPQEFQGWTFFNSNFAKEFEDKFDETVKVVREAGDILGLYKCNKCK